MSKRHTEAQEIPAVKTFQANVAALLALAKTEAKSSQADVAERSRLALRSLANFKAGKNAATLRSVQKVAMAFNLEPWQLLLPDLPASLVLSPRTRMTITTYLRNENARSAMDTVADLAQKTAA